MAQQFGSLPTRIFKPNVSNLFAPGRYTGRHIAAIKCLLALGLKNDFKTKLATLSYSQLESLTGCSKPMVIEGMRILERDGLVEKLPQSKTNVRNIYKLKYTDGKAFVRIPYDYLRMTLPEIPNKGAISLTALRIYLILLQVRPNQSRHVSISYGRLQEYGINKKLIYKALEILIICNLVRIQKVENDNGLGYTKTCNEYQIPHLNLPVATQSSE